jgi:hypothetical protein
MSRHLKRKNGGGRKLAPAGMKRVKIAISLPTEHVAAAQRAVSEGRASSVSAYVALALDRQADADSLCELIASMRAEDGPPSAEDYAWADAALGMSRSSRKRAPGRTTAR